MSTMKPFVERMALALSVLDDARDYLPAESVALSKAVEKMIEDGRRACAVLSPPKTGFAAAA